jgi:hypothetical protein
MGVAPATATAAANAAAPTSARIARAMHTTNCGKSLTQNFKPANSKRSMITSFTLHTPQLARVATSKRGEWASADRCVTRGLTIFTPHALTSPLRPAPPLLYSPSGLSQAQIVVASLDRAACICSRHRKWRTLPSSQPSWARSSVHARARHPLPTRQRRR